MFADLLQRLDSSTRRVAQTLRRHLLAGLAVCVRCGYSYHCVRCRQTRRPVVEYRYYRCRWRDEARSREAARCTNLPIRAEELEAVV